MSEEEIDWGLDDTPDTNEPGLRRKPPENEAYQRNLQRILDLQLPITVSFGTAQRPLSEVLKYGPGSLIELDKSADDPVVLKVNNRILAWGRVVDVDGYYGVEITRIVDRADRIASLGGES